MVVFHFPLFSLVANLSSGNAIANSVVGVHPMAVFGPDMSLSNWNSSGSVSPGPIVIVLVTVALVSRFLSGIWASF